MCRIWVIICKMKPTFIFYANNSSHTHQNHYYYHLLLSSSSSPWTKMIRTFTIRCQLGFPKHTSNPSIPKFHLITKPFSTDYANIQRKLQIKPTTKSTENLAISTNGYSRFVILGTMSASFAIFVMGFDDHKALALGPEGPLVEEFWDNMRRYGLYALTVSSGVLYAVFQPLYELLKNPISAILVLTVLGGGFYIVSQVVSAMVGVTDFSYQYSY